MSRTGCCYDNAAKERFFWPLKHEWTEHESFADLEEARRSVFEYIETFCGRNVFASLLEENSFSFENRLETKDFV